METVTAGGVTRTYDYDAYGRIFQVEDRYSNGQQPLTTYTYQDAAEQLSTRVAAMRTTRGTAVDVTYSYTYDGNGLPMAVDYNGTSYYYLTNLQGDVTGITDSSGALVVHYTYDAWGKPLSITGAMASALGTPNPLRGYFEIHAENY